MSVMGVVSNFSSVLNHTNDMAAQSASLFYSNSPLMKDWHETVYTQSWSPEDDTC